MKITHPVLPRYTVNFSKGTTTEEFYNKTPEQIRRLYSNRPKRNIVVIKPGERRFYLAFDATHMKIMMLDIPTGETKALAKREHFGNEWVITSSDEFILTLSILTALTTHR